jgi:hypothetical protein
MKESIDDFSDRLWCLGFRRIYLVHYEENEQLARELVKKLPAFQITVAADARKLGKDFVSKCIDNSDLTLVINPQSDARRLMLQFDAGFCEVDLGGVQ